MHLSANEEEVSMLKLTRRQHAVGVNYSSVQNAAVLSVQV